jgi:hypothetical protein
MGKFLLYCVEHKQNTLGLNGNRLDVTIGAESNVNNNKISVEFILYKA